MRSTMANLKRIEKRMNEVEKWVKDFERGTGPAQTMDNMNWLVAQCRQFGEQLSHLNNETANMQQAIQGNGQIVNAFVEKHDMVHDWQAHLAELQEEQNNAVQEQETESLSTQEQAEDGEEVGEEVPDEG